MATIPRATATSLSKMPMFWLRALPAPGNKLAVTTGGLPTVTFPVGAGSSTLEVRVHGQAVMVSVVEAVTV